MLFSNLFLLEVVPLVFPSIGGDFLSEQMFPSAFSILHPFPITSPLPSFVAAPNFHYLPLFGCLSLLWQTHNTSKGLSNASLLQLSYVSHTPFPQKPKNHSPQALCAVLDTTI